MKQIFATLATLLALACSAAPGIVQAHGSSRAAAEEEEAVSTSSGRAITVMATTRIEYVPAIRVWYDQAGTFMVCRHPGETYTFSSRRCELAGNKDIQAGWVGLPSLKLTGYALSAVQVNETRNGPSLVLYWQVVPVKAVKP